MTMRLSTGLRNFLAKEGSVNGALNNGLIEIYTGAQPATPDAAPTGTLLTVISNEGGAVTSEVLATGTLTLTAGAGGELNTLTVNGIDIIGGAVPFDGTLGQTAIDIATQINRFKSAPDYTATAAGDVVTISAVPGAGTSANGFVVAATATTLTETTTNMAGGVNPANGLQFDVVSAGVLPNLDTQTWEGVNVASGTAGWFRQYGSVADTHALDAAGVAIRLDGAIATAGAEMNLNNTAFAVGATTTLQAWTATVPAQ